MKNSDMKNVGIVIVSHSPLVAEGTADMVRQMVGEEVPLAWCGGNPEGGLGTSVGAIMEAIDTASFWIRSGVVEECLVIAAEECDWLSAEALSYYHRNNVCAEGAGALLTGFGPTAAGYFLQGAFKFGGYEFWKKTAIDFIGAEKASENRTAIYLGSSAIAEFFADVALCPLEATRIRLVSQPTFATGLLSGFSKILKEEGAIKGFYSGFGPILLKQVPYTMAKFVVFERTT